jgi:arylsulfatase A-like enzyme
VLSQSGHYLTGPVCSLRGQYAHNHSIIGNSPPEGGEPKFRQLGRDQSTIATWLNDAGYRTKLIGKYMNAYTDLYKPPGWDEWFALKQGSGPYGEVNRICCKMLLLATIGAAENFLCRDRGVRT